MKLPMTIVIGIAIAVIALVTIVVFFMSTGGGAAARTEMQNTFTQNCIAICARPDRGNINLAAAYPRWFDACTNLYGGQSPVECLERCECARLPSPCDYLCEFKATVANWQSFCNNIKSNPVTSDTYGSCDCSCPPQFGG